MQWSWLEEEREKKGVSELVGLLGCVRDEWGIDVCFSFFPFFFLFLFLFFWKEKKKVHEHDASLQY